MAPPIRSLVGEQFGRWTVVSFAGGKRYEIAWHCRCECGTERKVLVRSLKNGVSRSCGCLHDDYAASLRTHGMTRTREYKIWQGMVQRCTNPNSTFFSRYGGRGIGVCRQWLDSFEAFFGDMGKAPTKRHTLDRIDNDGNYEPGNVRWATRIQQARNTRTNRRLTFNGETMTVTEWAARLGLPVPTIFSRLRKRLPLHRVLSPKVDQARSSASRSRR